MKKFFEMHDDTRNMKAMITIFSLKGKENIWWEDVKCIKGIQTEEFSQHEFKRIFRKKYLLERYCDGKAKDFYELNMGSMIYEEYMTKFLGQLRYVPYLKDEKTKVQRLISGLPLAFKDHIEYDEPRSLEKFIGKLKHCYEQSKCKIEPKHDQKGNENTKGKWTSKWERPQVAREKENVAPYKNFSAAEKGHGPQPGEKLNKGNGREPLQ